MTLVAAVGDSGVNDPLTIQWTVVATNGQVITPATGDSFTFTPTDNGTYTVIVSVMDEALVATDHVVLIVTNVVPGLALSGNSTSDEGAVYTLTLEDPSDPGADTVTQYRVNWGDGSPVQTYNNPGEVTHVYANQGNRTITVTLVDEDGTHVNVAHLAATPLGMNVTFRSEVLSVNDRRVNFKVEAFDEKEKIAEGTHERAVIEIGRFATRLAAKTATVGKG